MPELAQLVLAWCGAVLTLSGFLGVMWWLVKPRVIEWVHQQVTAPLRATAERVEETHHQVTVNHHSSDKPTVLDRIDDVQRAVAGVADENRAQTQQLDSLERRTQALTVVMDDHLRWSRRWVERHGGDDVPAEDDDPAGP